MNWLDTILNEAVPAYLNRNVSFVLFFAVIMLARLTLTKFPKKYSYMLWGFLGIKAVFDFGFTLKLGEFTHKAGATMVEKGEAVYVGRKVGELLPVSKTVAVSGESIAAGNHYMQYVIPGIWALGVILILAYGLMGYVRLKRRVKLSFANGNGTYSCDYIESPMAFGILSPRIYIPTGVDASGLDHVIGHEMVHLRRHDTLFKLLAYLILAFYWINPVAWLAFKFFNLDMELSCDEAVLKKADTKAIENYGKWLVFFASNGKVFGPLPTAFGETDIEKRVKNMKKDKKIKGALAIVASLIVAVTAILCMLKAPEVFAKQSDKTTILSGESVSGSDISTGEDVSEEEKDPEEENDEAEAAETETAESEEAPSEPVVTDETWLWPMETKGFITSGFGERKALNDEEGETQYHDEVDVAAEEGTAVLAARSGIVEEAGWDFEDGYRVTIKVDDSVKIVYSHMLEELSVKAGDRVEQGTKVGEVGSTGLSTGPHLAFKIIVDGAAVDPMQFFEE